MSRWRWSHIADYASDFDSGDAIAIIWCIDDVYYTAEEMGFALTQQQARDVLSLMDSKHDAEYGICWETIRAHIDWIQYELKDKGETLAPVVPCPECEETPLNCDCDPIVQDSRDESGVVDAS